MTPKAIYWATNYNNKLACDVFVHVDLAPRGRLTEEMMNNTIIEIRTSDNSHPPVKVKLMDIWKEIPLKDIRCAFTWPSHGMDYPDFTAFLQSQSSEINASTLLAVYCYKKVTK